MRYLLVFLYGICFLACGRRAFDDKKFIFNKELYTLFSSIVHYDTMAFQNANGGSRLILKKSQDSIKMNIKGGLLAPRPYKNVSAEFIDSFDSIKYLPNIYINIYPDNGENSLFIKFGYVYLGIDTISQIRDTSFVMGTVEYNNIYMIEGKRDVKNYEDSNAIVKLFVDKKKGIISFQTANQTMWYRKK